MNVYGVWAVENLEWLEKTEEAVNDVVEEMEECNIMLPSLEAADTSIIPALFVLIFIP